MKHCDLDREFPCEGELMESQQCTDTLMVAVCLKCQTELRYVLGSDWITVIARELRQGRSNQLLHFAKIYGKPVKYFEVS